MLKTKLLHPEILQALAANGHGAKVLIADGNFPVSTQTPFSAKRVFLNLSPGVLTVTDILQVLIDFIPIESLTLMQPPDDHLPVVHEEVKKIVGAKINCEKLKRLEFYNLASDPCCCLVIASGDIRRFANILLTIGVIRENNT